MYKLFNRASPNSQGVRLYPRFDYISTVMAGNVQRLTSWYRSGTFFVDSNHLLANLLNSLDVHYGGDDQHFAAQVLRRQYDLAGGFGLVSEANRGRVHRGVFYHPRGHEILVLLDNPLPKGLASVWQDVQPIRILDHPRSDLSVESLDGSGGEPEVGTAVVLIDLPLLALQFEYWKRSPQAGSDTSRRDVQHFLIQYPLTNAIHSHLDVALLNRLHRRATTHPCSDYQRRVPFAVRPTAGAVDDVLDQTLDRLTATDLTFDDMLRNTPAFFSPNALGTVQVYDVAHTQQITWALMVARIDVVSLLLQITDETQSARNAREIVEIRRDLVRAESGKLLSNGLPGPMSREIRDRIRVQIEPFI